jgi:MFS family permease
VALIVDASTFVVIAIAVMGLETRRYPAGSEAGKGEARAGLSLIRADRVLALAFAVFAGVLLFATMDNVAEVFFARDTLGAGAWGYGVLASVWLVGMALGASLVARRLRTDQLGTSIMLAGILAGAAVGTAAAFPALGLAIAMFVVGGFANGIFSVSMRSLVVHRMEDRFLGRVFAFYGGLANGMLIAATAIAGALVAAFGPRVTLLIGGLGAGVVAFLGLLAYAALPTGVRQPPGEASQLPGEAPQPEAPAATPERPDTAEEPIGQVLEELPGVGGVTTIPDTEREDEMAHNRPV